MIRYWSNMSVVIATFLLGFISATEVKDPRRFILDQHSKTCPHGEELHCLPFTMICGCYHKVDGGWSDWSSTSCSTTCGDGVREVTRSCTNPAPMFGGDICTGDSFRRRHCTNGPCPSTNRCTSDLSCFSLTCPEDQHPFCEPYLDWSQCGCTECTTNTHCSCTGEIARTKSFERKCECTQPPAIDGGWSAWSSKSCSTTCGDGVRVETRTCTNPAPMHGGNICTGESTRQSNCTNGPCPTTAPQTINQCTSDLNCSSFTCPGHQYSFCEPYLDWSQCGCTECTRDEHCHCPQGMIGNCRDDIFERKCECQQFTGTFSHCTDDADCSTHKCTGNLRQSFCHKNKLPSFDLSNCDCRECSEDSHCQCQSGLIPHCELTTFGNTCQCKQPNNITTTFVPNVSNTPSTTQTLTSESTSTETSTPPSTEHTTIAPSSTATEAITTRTTKTTTTTTTPTPKSTTITTPSTTTTTTKATTTHTSTTTATTTGSSSVLSSETTILTSSASTAQSVTEHSTSALSNITFSPITPTVTTTIQPQIGKRKCHVCGDYDSQFSCDTRSIFLGKLQDCPVGADYCMTDIIHDGGTYPSTYKRCVTEVECANKWLHQTSDLDQCINYGNVINDGQFSCHFCCTSDGCNSGQIPDKSTFYIKV